MSEYDQSDDTVDDEPDGPAGLRQHAKRLEQQAREAEQRAAAAERELAFAKAGLPLDDPKMSYFVKGYDGDLSPEAIKAAAEQAGFLGSPAPAVPPEELRGHQDVANLAAGAQVAGGWTGPLHENPQYIQEMRSARGPDEALAVMARYGSPIINDFD